MSHTCRNCKKVIPVSAHSYAVETGKRRGSDYCCVACAEAHVEEVAK